MLITKRSPLTGEMNSLDLPVTGEQIANWRSGALIQNVMPQLNAGQREFLISGVYPGEWDATVPKEEDNE
jgi:hypothetical protein